MSSMRNAVQRRNHKERAQPLEREKWGLLEKRKDYKLRAADHREKKKRIKTLKEKALLRNPDEFSFAMMSSKVDKHGRKIADRGNKAMDVDVVKLLKTQDTGYIRTMLQMVRKEREELEKRIVLEDQEVRALKDGEGGRKAQHKVFVRNEEEQQEFDIDEWFGKGGDWPDRSKKGNQTQPYKQDDDDGFEETKPRKLSKREQEARILAEKEGRVFEKKRERTQERAEARLEAVKAREQALLAAEEELERQRAKMNNTVGGVNKHGVKFKVRERKR